MLYAKINIGNNYQVYEDAKYKRKLFSHHIEYSTHMSWQTDTGAEPSE